MARRGDDGCTLIMIFFSVIATVIYSIILAFQGKFTLIKIILAIAAIIWVLYLWDKAKERNAISHIKKLSNTNTKEKKSSANVIVFIIITTLIVTLIRTWKKNENQLIKNRSIEYIPPVITVDENLPIIKEEKKEVIWFFKTFNNISFQLPENLEISSEYSNKNSTIYFDTSSNFSFLINCNMLNDENLNANIEDIPIDLQQYAQAFNENNKLNFDDFKLDNYEISPLGNKSSIKIEQSSRKVSGIKNIEMKVVSYNVISKPYYYDITYSYPKDSIKYDTIFKKIEKSFIFKDIE